MNEQLEPQSEPSSFPVGRKWVELVVESVTGDSEIKLQDVLDMASGVDRDDVTNEGLHMTPFDVVAEHVVQHGWTYSYQNVLEAFGREILRLQEKYEASGVE